MTPLLTDDDPPSKWGMTPLLATPKVGFSRGFRVVRFCGTERK